MTKLSENGFLGGQVTYPTHAAPGVYHTCGNPKQVLGHIDLYS